jgi:hypothetical protein
LPIEFDGSPVTVHGSSIARDGFLISSADRAIDFHEKLILHDPGVDRVA